MHLTFQCDNHRILLKTILQHNTSLNMSNQHKQNLYTQLCQSIQEEIVGSTTHFSGQSNDPQPLFNLSSTNK
jgi:hypothetical protein